MHHSKQEGRNPGQRQARSNSEHLAVIFFCRAKSSLTKIETTFRVLLASQQPSDTANSSNNATEAARHPGRLILAEL